MGQYFKFVNVDKREEPKEKVSFAKLTEHSYLGNEYCDSVLSLLSNQWKGDRIIHVGDYAEDGDGASTDNLVRSLKRSQNIPKLYFNDFLKVSSKDNSKQIRYVFNHDKKEYIDLLKQPIQWVGIEKNELYTVKFNSFALLTACGNGLGGGDYHDSLVNCDKVGLWAGDHFTSSSEFLKEYTDYNENNLIFNEMNRSLSRLKNLTTDEYTITNWNASTEETIINCNMDLIEEYFNDFKDYDLSDSLKIKIDSKDLLPSEISCISCCLTNLQERIQKYSQTQEDMSNEDKEI